MDKIWEEIHSSSGWGKYPSIEVVSYVARNFYKLKRDEIKILDYGCGQGANTWFLAREGFNTYAFDGAPSAVKKAEEYLRSNDLKANFDVMYGDNLKYKNDFFDCVVDCAVVYANRIETIEKMVREIYRVLKTGGKTISTGLFNSKMTGYATGDEIEKNTYTNMTGVLANRGVCHFFEKDEAVNLWSKIGFKNIEIDEKIVTQHNGNLTIAEYILTAEK